MTSLSKKILIGASVALAAGTPAEALAAYDYSRDLAAWERKLDQRRLENQREQRAADFDDRDAPPPVLREQSENIGLSFGIEGFYALALDDLYNIPAEYEGEKFDGIDLYGVNLRVGYTILEADKNNPLSLETFGILGFGYGEDSKTTSESYGDEYYSFTESEKDKHEITQFHAALGVNVRFHPTEWLAFALGGQIGVANVKWKREIAYSYENKNYPEFNEDEKFGISDSDLGLLYGVNFGAEFQPAQGHIFSLGVGYAGTTAQPKLKEDGETIAEAEKQSYVVFSVGYRYAF